MKLLFPTPYLWQTSLSQTLMSPSLLACATTDITERNDWLTDDSKLPVAATATDPLKPRTRGHKTGQVSTTKLWQSCTRVSMATFVLKRVLSCLVAHSTSCLVVHFTATCMCPVCTVAIFIGCKSFCCPHNKGLPGGGGAKVQLLIFNSWLMMVSFTMRLLFRFHRKQWYFSKRGMSGPQSHYKFFGKGSPYFESVCILACILLIVG